MGPYAVPSKIPQPKTADMTVYTDLARFIESEMRMAQVYQPVFLTLMLESDHGIISAQEAAEAFRQVLDADEKATFDVRRFPGAVLAKREIVEQVGEDEYRLLGFDELLPHERRSLIELCDARLELYLSGSGSSETRLGPGRVYVLRSAATPTLFKVGYTTTRAEYRAKEISRGTGVPSEFEVYYESVRVDDAYQLEQAILADFADARPNPRKEFLEMRVLMDVIERLPAREGD